jgi:hypothetical protein
MSTLPNGDNPEVVHEESDVNVRMILGFGVGLVVVAVVVHVFLWWLLGAYNRQAERAQTHVYPLAAGHQDNPPPGPRLQDNPQQDMRDLRARQEGLLKGYAWVNRGSGIARIPIEDAMRLVVERGLPTKEAAK